MEPHRIFFKKAVVKIFQRTETTVFPREVKRVFMRASQKTVFLEAK
jgi:hypothetical protein